MSLSQDITSESDKTPYMYIKIDDTLVFYIIK